MAFPSVVSRQCPGWRAAAAWPDSVRRHPPPSGLEPASRARVSRRCPGDWYRRLWPGMDSLASRITSYVDASRRLWTSKRLGQALHSRLDRRLRQSGIAQHQALALRPADPVIRERRHGDAPGGGAPARLAIVHAPGEIRRQVADEMQSARIGGHLEKARKMALCRCQRPLLAGAIDAPLAAAIA